MRQCPQRTSPSSATGVRSSQSRSYSRTACTPPPRSTRFEPTGDESSSASAGGRVSRSSSARSRFASAAGMDAPQQREHLLADQAADRVAVRRVFPERKTCAQAVASRVFAPDAEQRAHDAVLALDLDALRVSARHEPVEDRLHLVREGVSGSAEPVRREPVTDLAQLVLGRRRRLRRRRRRRARRGRNARPHRTPRRASRGSRVARRRGSRASGGRATGTSSQGPRRRGR